MISPTLSLDGVVTILVLLITGWNTWQNMQITVKIAELKVWIFRNFVSKNGDKDHD